MTLAERKRIDNFIKEYLLLGIRIKVAKSKIIHARYNNKRIEVKKLQKVLHQLEQLKTNIESNINNKYLGDIKVFKMDVDEAIQELNISKGNLFKLKKEIREEFYKIIEIVEAD